MRAWCGHGSTTSSGMPAPCSTRRRWSNCSNRRGTMPTSRSSSRQRVATSRAAVARARVRERDRVDRVLCGDLLELVERAEHALAARVVEATDDHRAGLAEGPRQRIRHGSAARDQHPVDRRVEPAEARNQERCGAGNGHGQQRVHRGQAVARDILDEREAQGEPRERGGRAMSAGPGCERDRREEDPGDRRAEPDQRRDSQGLALEPDIGRPQLRTRASQSRARTPDICVYRLPRSAEYGEGSRKARGGKQTHPRHYPND